MKGSLTENLIGFVKDLKIEAVDLINQARASLTMGNKQSAEFYLRASKSLNTAANNLIRIDYYLNSVNLNLRV